MKRKYRSCFAFYLLIWRGTDLCALADNQFRLEQFAAFFFALQHIEKLLKCFFTHEFKRLGYAAYRRYHVCAGF